MSRCGMPAQRLTLSPNSPTETADLAASLSGQLAAGDVVLLEGDMGAGKTHFARALIQSVMAEPEDVPSPTFTLVQTYPTPNAEIWHADLYRLTSTLEIEELGLVEAFETAICLVEWPDRLGALSPDHALKLHLSAGRQDDARMLQASWTASKWDAKLKVWQP